MLRVYGEINFGHVTWRTPVKIPHIIIYYRKRFTLAVGDRRQVRCWRASSDCSRRRTVDT